MPRLRRGLLIGLLTAALVAAAQAQAATWVSYPQLLTQVRTGRLVRAVINRAPAHIEIKFASGREWEAVYPRRDQRMLQRTLHTRHIEVIFAARPHARAGARQTHHRLRYITTAALATAVALGAGLFLLDTRRRRRLQARAAAPAG
jgi:hypothetical protein